MRIDLQQAVTRESAEEALRSFWHWWCGELLSLLPLRWRQVLARISSRPVVHFADGLCLIAVPGREDEIGVEADLAPQLIRKALSQELGHDLSDAVTLRLPSRRVLRRTVRAPIAALPRLKSAIGLQIERICPFRADAVAYSSIAERARDGETEVNVDVAIVTLATLLDYEGWLGECGLGVARFEAGPHTFAPSSRRLRAEPRMTAAAIAGLGIAFLFAAYALAPVFREAEYESQARSVARLRAEASTPLKTKERLDDVAAPLASLAGRENVPSVLDALKSVTIAFPQTVRLQTLAIDGRNVRAIGTMTNARSLVAILRAAPRIESADLIGPIRRTATGLDRFVIQLSVRP